jgi:hypothetical protein
MNVNIIFVRRRNISAGEALVDLSQIVEIRQYSALTH